LSYVPKENGADAFYTKFGFIDTGEIHGKKEIVMKYQLSSQD